MLLCWVSVDLLQIGDFAICAQALSCFQTDIAKHDELFRIVGAGHLNARPLRLSHGAPITCARRRR
jgi:hypothetical protein